MLGPRSYLDPPFATCHLCDFICCSLPAPHRPRCWFVMMTTLSGLCPFLFLLGVLSSHISHASVHVSPYLIAHLSLPSVKWEDLTSAPPPLCSLLYLLLLSEDESKCLFV